MKPDWCDEATWERAASEALMYVEWLDPKPAEYAQSEYVLASSFARVLIAAKNEGLEEGAALAETFMHQTDFDLEPEAAVSENVTAKSIAAAIRSRIQKE